MAERLPEVSRSEPPVRTGRHGYPSDHPYGYDRCAEKITETLRPKWSGEDSTWEDFWKAWKYFWSLKSKTVGDDDRMKCLIFVECLPMKEQQRARNFVIQDEMSFDALIKVYESDVMGMVPLWEREQAWRNCWPVSRDYKDMLHWWTDWNRLADKAENITYNQKLQQFDRIMLKHCDAFLRNLLRLEVTG